MNGTWRRCTHAGTRCRLSRRPAQHAQNARGIRYIQAELSSVVALNPPFVPPAPSHIALNFSSVNQLHHVTCGRGRHWHLAAGLQLLSALWCDAVWCGVTWQQPPPPPTAIIKLPQKQRRVEPAMPMGTTGCHTTPWQAELVGWSLPKATNNRGVYAALGKGQRCMQPTSMEE